MNTVETNRVAHASPCAVDTAWVKQTSLYQLASRRRAEVDVHKWYESERAGGDIGVHRAVVSYVIHQTLSRYEPRYESSR